MRSLIILSCLAFVACAPQIEDTSSFESASSAAGVSSVQADFQPVALEGREYRNDKHRFSVAVPDGSMIQQESDHYIRLQNYDGSTSSGMYLSAGAYYLEIFTVDSGYDGCMQSIVDPEPVTIGGVHGYRGTAVEASGHMGGDLFGLCLRKTDWHIYLLVVENNPAGPIANAIFDSFRLL